MAAESDGDDLSFVGMLTVIAILLAIALGFKLLEYVYDLFFRNGSAKGGRDGSPRRGGRDWSWEGDGD